MYQTAMFGKVKAPASRWPYTPRIIYETKGRAREYRELACNLYNGCDHRCVYCYAPKMMQRNRAAFGRPTPRKDIIAKLRKDAAYRADQGETRQVLFCFTCDPYQKADVEHGLTRQAIEACHQEGMAVCTLTKGGSRALRDLDLFTPADSFATTLTTLDPVTSVEWEPGAALPEDRIAALATFHEKGVPTWVSLEPVLDPDTTLEIIRQTHSFVDEYKVGKLNYHPRGAEIDWRQFALDVRDLLESLGCAYYLKEDLRRLL